ncbi:hypothetical protein [Allostreptomyces psammosilenae]|uniref:DUF3558 domain-containing protein n=1 Tax=Allostreptomyces psammosilenae TaxID=1892865 RepID=A0A852ZXR5_9ACTN|nr:hypothetical protein [Allostreptomyces psammosilenae]NYI06557.1 hypothetical protein [Allostreptomyces psammosilenae]
MAPNTGRRRRVRHALVAFAALSLCSCSSGQNQEAAPLPHCWGMPGDRMRDYLLPVAGEIDPETFHAGAENVEEITSRVDCRFDSTEGAVVEFLAEPLAEPAIETEPWFPLLLHGQTRTAYEAPGNGHWAFAQTLHEGDPNGIGPEPDGTEVLASVTFDCPAGRLAYTQLRIRFPDTRPPTAEMAQATMDLLTEMAGRAALELGCEEDANLSALPVALTEVQVTPTGVKLE